MIFNPTKTPKLIRLALVGSLSFAMALYGEDVSLELKEAQVALDAAVKRIKSLEDQNQTLVNANLTLGESLITANKEAEDYRKSYEKALRQLESLGPEAIDADGDSIQSRLMRALSDLRILEENKEDLGQVCAELAASVSAYMAGAESSDAKARLKVEASLRKMDRKLGFKGQLTDELFPSAPELSKVISYKKELGLIVCNAGKREGMRVGTPIRIQRKDRSIATGLIVSVRDRISGAIVRQMLSKEDQIQVEDLVRIDPQHRIQEDSNTNYGS